jgi:molybdate transport system substrate-binding protein
MATRAILADLAESYEQRSGRRVAIESVGGVDAGGGSALASPST